MIRAVVLAAAALAGGAPDQTIDRDQGLAADRAVLADGHVDLGPRFVGGRWTLLVHDGDATVWRHADRTVLRVGDAARQTVPDDPAYAFLRAKPGARVHVVPQTQDPDVVWVGWNTQDPEVMERIDRGVTMTLTGVQGPGALVVYLQSGTFDAPEVLWDSEAEPKPAWVDVNTHTHANWVFTRPGVYLVRVRIEAELVDGSTVRDTRALRFAVGPGASVDEAFAAAWTGPAEERAVVGERAADEDHGGLPPAAIAAIVVVALLLAAGLPRTVRRGARVKAAAREGRT